MATQFCLGTFLVLIAIGCVASKSCTRQADCDPYFECCAKKAFTGEINCVKRLTPNAMCLANGMDEVLYNGVYDINCPCQYGYQCLQDVTLNENGEETSLPANPRCRGPAVRPPPTSNEIDNQGSGNNN